VALRALVERRPELFLLRCFRLDLLRLRALFFPLGELRLDGIEFMAEVGRGRAILGRVPDVARDVLELVLEDALHGGLRAPVVLRVHVRVPGLRVGPELARRRLVDAIVFGLLLEVFLLPLFQRLHLRRVPFDGLGEMLVAFDLVEFGEALALLRRRLLLGRLVGLGVLLGLGLALLVLLGFGIGVVLLRGAAGRL
jgi:hypothetical protein